MLQQHAKSRGRRILLQNRLIDTLHPNQHGWKIYQGHRGSSVDATPVMFASSQRKEIMLYAPGDESPARGAEGFGVMSLSSLQPSG